MSKKLYYHLETQDIRLDNVHEQVLKFKKDKIVNILNGCIESIEIYKNETFEADIHDLNFALSLEFTGSCDTCQNTACVEITANNLLRFATLYSSKTYLWEPFTKHLNWKDFSDFGRFVLANDLMTVLLYKEAVLSNMLIFVREDVHFCSNCYSENLLGSGTTSINLFETLRQETRNLYKENCSYILTPNQDPRSDEVYIIDIEPKEPKYTIHKPTQAYYSPKNKLFSKVRKRNSKKIYKNEVHKFPGILKHADDIADKIVRQNYLSELTNSHFLTPHEVDMEIINSVNSNSDNTEHFNILNSLNHAVPYISELPVSDIIELRNKDSESFINYRYEIQRLHKELGKDSNLNADEYFKDVIRPKLNEIDKTVKNFKKAKKKSIIHNAVMASGYITIGAFNLFDTRFATALSALGGFNHGKELQKNILSEYPDEVIENKLFFLWKLKNK